MSRYKSWERVSNYNGHWVDANGEDDCPSTVCNPSRRNVLTGRYVLDNNGQPSEEEIAEYEAMAARRGDVFSHHSENGDQTVADARHGYKVRGGIPVEFNPPPTSIPVDIPVVGWLAKLFGR